MRVVAGKYVLTRQIGRGGMGLVWEAFDQQLRRRVALKLMTPDHIASPALRRRFEREAMAAARLTSPNVVRIYDYGVDTGAGAPYLVMELLEGEDLESRLARQPRLPLPRLISLLGQIASGLGAAHAVGLVHCDLKPANIFLTRGDTGETAKILDFGIAFARSDSVGGSSTTSGRFLLGTPAYMSPEQLREAEIDHRSDLWSLAVVAYQALTGRLPFEGRSIGDVIMKIFTDAFPPPTQVAPELPPDLDALFERALAKDPAERFASPRALHAAFAAIGAACGAGPIKVLVVDDERDVALLIEQCFDDAIRRGAYTFLFAGDGEEALAEIARHPDVDVILTDLNMPRMDGLTLLERVAELCPAARTVVVSAYDDMSNIRAAMNRGAFDFLVKPIDFQDLGATLEKTSRHVAELRRGEGSREENRVLRMLVDASLGERLRDIGPAAALGSQAFAATAAAIEVGASPQATQASASAPEEVLRELNASMEVIVPEILSRGGVVDHFAGRGLLAIFHGESHAQRAIEACLAARGRLEVMAARAGEGSPYARGMTAGLASGQVITGAVGSRTFGRIGYTALGDAPRLAAELARAAAPGEILAGAGVAEQARGRFGLGAERALALPGRAELVTACATLGWIAWSSGEEGSNDTTAPAPEEGVQRAPELVTLVDSRPPSAPAPADEASG